MKDEQLLVIKIHRYFHFLGRGQTSVEVSETDGRRETKTASHIGLLFLLLLAIPRCKTVNHSVLPYSYLGSQCALLLLGRWGTKPEASSRPLFRQSTHPHASTLCACPYLF